MGGFLKQELLERLEARRAEIEETILARINSVDGSADGLPTAVAAAVGSGFAVIEAGEGGSKSIPTALLVQARYAARNGVNLDIVLRRYFAGYTLLGDFIRQEAEAGGLLESAAYHRLVRAQAALFDRVIVAVSDEYSQESGRQLRTAEHGRVERVRKILAGELVDAIGLDYEFDNWHVGAVATGPGASQAIRGLASLLDRRLLLVRPGEETVWVWFGGRRRVAAEEVACLAAAKWPAEVALTIGEPGRGVSGWRLTHRQALAALPVAMRGSQSLVRYADVALLASVLRDDVLSSSLSELYLAPLARERDGGVALRRTLDAYFSAARNVSSAAAALGVSRQTVNSRLRAIEERIGRPLDSCAAELETVLRLRDLLPGDNPSHHIGKAPGRDQRGDSIAVP